jgi:hypothetical protein
MIDGPCRCTLCTALKICRVGNRLGGNLAHLLRDVQCGGRARDLHAITKTTPSRWIKLGLFVR